MNPEEVAIDRCDYLIQWYNNSRRWMRALHYTSQMLLISSTAITPILILLSQQESVKNSTNFFAVVARSAVLHASFSAVAAVVVGTSALVQWQKKWTARSCTCELLKAEKVKYLTRSGESYETAISDENARSRFVTNIERLASEELMEWKQLQSATAGRPN